MGRRLDAPIGQESGKIRETGLNVFNSHCRLTLTRRDVLIGHVIFRALLALTGAQNSAFHLQMTWRQNFDAVPGMDRTVFMLSIGHYVEFDVTSKFFKKSDASLPV